MHTLLTRLLLLGGLLGAEVLIATLLLDGGHGLPAKGLAAVIRAWGPFVARTAVVFAGIFASFAFLRNRAILDQAVAGPVQYSLLAAHAIAAAVFAFASKTVYQEAASPSVAAAWLLAAFAMPLLAAAAFARWEDWWNFAHGAGRLWLHAALGTAVALVGAKLFQSAWQPASRLTFSLVESILRPMYGESYVSVPEQFRLGTTRFAVIISEQCSGLEGIGLLIAFGVVCLILFREELRFPHCLALFPIGAAILFLLNTVRIAVLVTIGHWGARDIAVGGFHSQAGWIAFNGVAFGLCLAARRWKWIWLRSEETSAVRTTDPTTAFLAPFLAIVAAGMLSSALSASFEWLYGLRVAAASALLWRYRETYAAMNWKAGWPAVVAGVGVFVVWIGFDWLLHVPEAPMPRPLGDAGMIARTLWIALRVIGAVVIVPIAEELAFRGFLLRRIGNENFEQARFRDASWVGVELSSIVFGVLHGSRWPAGIAAGLVFAWAARKHERIGDAVVAHAITNGLIVALVLGWGQWRLW